MTTYPTAAEVQQIAQSYQDLGWLVVPDEWKSKVPAKSLGEWKDTLHRMAPADVLREFGVLRNIGVVVGSPSGWLTDIDLDCPETVELAPRYLPPTVTFGRAGKPRSHWLYIAKGCSFAKYSDVAPRGTPPQTLVEIRANKLDTKGLDERDPNISVGQTVFPGSVHADTGEVIWWTEESVGKPGPTVIDAAELHVRVGMLASAALALRRAPRDAVLAWLDGAPCPSLCPPGCAHEDKTPKDGVGVACPSRLFRAWRALPNKQPQPKARDVRFNGATKADFASAAAEYNRANPRTYDSDNGPCPVCGSPGGFKASDVPGKWVCFSTRHTAFSDVGTETGTREYIGDALDIDAFMAGCEPHELLRKFRFLK